MYIVLITEINGKNDLHSRLLGAILRNKHTSELPSYAVPSLLRCLASALDWSGPWTTETPFSNGERNCCFNPCLSCGGKLSALDDDAKQMLDLNGSLWILEAEVSDVRSRRRKNRKKSGKKARRTDRDAVLSYWYMNEWRRRKGGLRQNEEDEREDSRRA